jgi:hypothetical protein
VRFDDRDGRTWKVRRRWLPWRRRVRELPDAPIDGLSADDPISAIISLFLLILAIPALVVLAILLAELVLVVALLPVVVLLRLVAGWAGFPWPIEVSSRPGRRRVGGWRLERTERVKTRPGPRRSSTRRSRSGSARRSSARAPTPR